MNNPFSYLLPVHLVVVLIGLIGTTPIGSAQIAKPSSGQSPQPNAVTQKILGEWHGKDSTNPSIPLTALFFAPDGTLTVFFAAGQQTNAIGTRYTVNPNTQPMQTSWVLLGGSTNTTIFEFTADGRLRLEQFGKTTPKKFEVNDLMQKVSNTTTLKPDAQRVAKQIAGQSGEAEGRVYVSLLVQAQQAYYLETGKFATSIAQLGIDLKSETADYRYQVVREGNEAEQIRIVGRAKRSGLKSFTGAVFLTLKMDTLPKGMLSGVVCETFRASQLTPAMPKYPSNPFDFLQCPSGSQGVGSDRALKN